MIKLENVSSVFGGVAAVNPLKGATKLVYVSGVSFEIPGAGRFIRKKGKKGFPTILVLYTATGVFPENEIIAVYVAPTPSVWRTIQAAAEKGDLTQAMVEGYGPKLVRF
jgi:TM2 domain-containing membrane protein YozV